MSDNTARTTKEEAHLIFVGTQAGVFVTLLVLLFFNREDVNAAALVGIFLFVLLCIDFVLVVFTSESKK